MKAVAFFASFACALVWNAAQAGAPSVASTAQAEHADMVVTLLGTGSPSLSPERFGPSTLVQANGLNLMFDAGRGSTIRLAQLGVPLGAVNATFLTHFHSDHINGLADLWATSYLPSPQNRRTSAFQLYGPQGTQIVAEGLRMTMTADLLIRQNDNESTAEAQRIEVHSFHRPGVVFDEKGVKVTAFPVNHGAAIKPSYGYKVQYKGHTVTLSGDTRYDPRVIENAKGADVLVHEVNVISTHHQDEAWAKPIREHHTSPEEAGKVFAQAQPKLAVFSHISRPGPQDETNTDAMLLQRAQQVWPQGKVVVGSDLMRIYVGKDVTYSAWAP